MDLRAVYADLASELGPALESTAASGRYVLGDEVAAFEGDFAQYCGAGHCVGVASGLDALTLLLRAHDVGSGHEVIVPSNTYIATWLAVTAAGATPVPVEPSRETSNLDPTRVEGAITSQTKVVLAVHLYGQPADTRALSAVCSERGLLLLEDAAQAHGARVSGRRVGSLGNGAAFSFYPTKNLGAMGDAGAVVTEDPDLADRVRVLRNYGSRRKYDNETKGVNSRLDEIQAAVLRVKLRHLDRWNAMRRELAGRYDTAFVSVPGLTTPHQAEWAESVYHVYVVHHDDRDGLKRHLDERDIGSLIYYPVPPHLSGAYRDAGFAPGSFPLAEELAGTNLALPLHPYLADEEQAEVIEAVVEYRGP